MAPRAAGLALGMLLLLAACTPRPAVEAPVPPSSRAAGGESLRLAHADIGPVDAVLVEKSARRLYLLRGGAVLAWVPISLGRQPVGPKRRQGDFRTPEGEYILDWRNPNSQFHRSIHISYPNAADRERAGANGIDPGGAIFIHGTPDPILLGRDWTNGCIAVSNQDIDLIWRLVRDGAPITIRP